MTQQTLTFLNGPIFDGLQLRAGLAARFESGKLVALGPENVIGRAGKIVDLAGDILGPGYVDLQVNGGDGVMFNDDPSVSTLRRIAGAHRRLGVAALLPTLITDTREKTQAAIAAAIEAVREAVPGIAGLHLEGPHLSLARKGAHDPALIRPMDDEDLAMLLAAAAELPVLKITIAPENVTLEQVQTLARAGVLVSLGHSDANFDTCQAYFAAGARCVTHLFNAMSQLGNRNPGLVGATLANGAVSAGLIADGIHVHPQSLRTAWAAKTGPGRLFLVSDAMAVAGSDATQFTLEGRLIRREGGRLTLEDGTLAGADLDLTTAIRVLVNDVGVSLPEALRAATSAPAAIIGQTNRGQLAIGCKLDSVIRIDALLGTFAQAG
ncbi:N-acetylglucosamine-6-phosphate deacetylase [Sedimentimonas flavescens]|uniref:N-acetylglucosamine-6-phosphate deacetylase n=1 Tax=Sedimentimonas flavescens TaxID=2851012 RepID=A0ABT2ZVD1_9RHOB|nr:N-acetylglucosamine-6-phosphate deacetylase [Sedimentimonas flavescens]MCV2877709.1 N-acetylglucosamine-6-phosphate deacetylase [Sedimentimonas flavescens]